MAFTKNSIHPNKVVPLKVVFSGEGWGANLASPASNFMKNFINHYLNKVRFLYIYESKFP